MPFFTNRAKNSLVKEFEVARSIADKLVTGQLCLFCMFKFACLRIDKYSYQAETPSTVNWKYFLGISSILSNG